MNRLRWVLMAVAVLWGLLSPELYEWSGEDQSRPSAILRWLALGILLFDAMAIGWLLWQHVKRPAEQTDAQRHRFGIRHVLLVTTLVAVVVSGERMIALPLTNGVVVVLAVVAAWQAIRRPAARWPIVGLLVCLWAPFLWVFRWPEFRGNMLQIMMMIPGAPALLPAIWTSHLIGSPKLGESTLPGLFTMIELLVGLWLIRLGPRPSLAFLLLALTASLLNSFAFQALVRM